MLLAERRDGADGIAGLDLGADDYVVKPVRLNEFVARLRALLRRVHAPQPSNGHEVLGVGELRIDTAGRRVFRGSQELYLPQKEYELLLFLVRYRGVVWPREQLLAHVWGQNPPGDARTIDVHVRWLRSKIEGDPSRPIYIQTVRGIGYRFAEA